MMACTAGLAIGLCIAPLCVFAQSKAQQDALTIWMDRIAQQQLTEREKTIAAISSKAAAEKRKAFVRAKLLELLGGLPDYHGPLNARVTGRLTNASYTIEKVVFESLPRYYVTADLYRPNQPGRYPAVLMSAGHTMLGKTENHRMAANLATKGFVAIAYDPVGLGERMQGFDSRIGKSIAGCCTNEHLHAGAQSQLIGESVARYFIWDGMRAIDYLVSRPDVDPDHIGAAGCSGGGCLTAYIGALDPRIKAAAPACFINSLRLLYAGPLADSEMSLPDLSGAGLDHGDFLEVAAPMPWLILATEGDFFTPPGARMVYDEARRWYRLYGAEENLRFFVGPGPHGTPLETRETLYSFMIRWLKNNQGDPHEQHETPLYLDHDLQVTKSGQVDDELGGRKLYEVIREEFRARRQPLGRPELLAELRKMKIPSSGSAPVVRTLEEAKDTHFRRLRISLEVERNLETPATLYLPQARGRRPALIVVKDRFSTPVAETAAGMGSVVLELEPRDAPSANDNRTFLGNWQTNLRANTIGLNLPAMRAHDVLLGVDLLSAREDVDPSRIYATAMNLKGIWLLLAAAVDPRIAKLWLDHTPHTFSSALDGPLVTNLLEAVIPGFLLHWDLPDLAGAVGERRLLWTDPTDWMGRILPLGAGFRYRYSEQTDDLFLAELFGK